MCMGSEKPNDLLGKRAGFAERRRVAVEAGQLARERARRRFPTAVRLRLDIGWVQYTNLAHDELGAACIDLATVLGCNTHITCLGFREEEGRRPQLSRRRTGKRFVCRRIFGSTGTRCTSRRSGVRSC